MWLLVLDWLRRAWPALAVCLVVAVLCYSHHCSYERGRSDCDAEWRQRAADQQTERLKELRDAERKAQERQDAIVRDYTEEMELLRAEQEMRIREMEDEKYELVNAFSPVCAGGTYADGVCRCQGTVTGGDSGRGVPAGTGNKSGTACYSEDRLRRQIAESVAIAQECDREMTRFRALIEACGAR